MSNTVSVIERLRENIIADAFERREIISGQLSERPIRERHEAADLLEEAVKNLKELNAEIDAYWGGDKSNRRMKEICDKQQESLALLSRIQNTKEK